MSYLKWNDALAAHFFKTEEAGNPVYLYVTSELISELHGRLGDNATDFITAVKTGPPWATRQGICQKAIQAVDEWRWRDLSYPPYIAYLSLFVLAAGAEGGWALHAYYPRLWEILGESREGMLPSFDRMDELWEDLEQWTVFDKSSELGVFRARSAGNWIHVGYPIAQTILTEHERKALPSIFASSDLDPTSPPSELHLARILRQHRGLFRPRTQRLLENRQDSDALAALVEVVEQELLDWDGLVPETSGSYGDRLRPVHGALRLCLRLNTVASQVNATLRCKLNRDYPDGEMRLVRSSQAMTLVCEEYLGGWSSPLSLLDQAIPADASRFDWLRGLRLREEQLGWRLTLHGASVRVFVSGEPEGLPGLIEIHRLPHNYPFFILFHGSVWNSLDEWSRIDCVDFREIPVTSGLPSGWILAHSKAATNDQRVRSAFPVLSFAQQFRINLRGGLRSFGGTNFFAFAPPDISIDGGDGTEVVRCHGAVLNPRAEDGLYALPADLPTDSRIVIEVQSGGRVRTQSVYLTSEIDWAFVTPVRLFDQWGALVDSKDQPPLISGALVDPIPDAMPFVRSPVLAEGFGNRNLFLLGRHPGQVIDWPAEELSTSWLPVWAVGSGRHRRVIYCGGDVDSSAPSSDVIVADKRRIRLWKEILWHRRKRVKTPAQDSLRRLLREYQEVARRV